LFNFEVSSIISAYSLLKTIYLENMELFHTTIIPPEAPCEGKCRKESKAGGQKFLI